MLGLSEAQEGVLNILFKIAEDENPCYSFDFLKVDDTVNELDWFPGQTFDSFGKTINCKNYKEFLEQKP